MFNRLLVFLALVLAGCSGCSPLKIVARDTQAESVQQVMRRSVRVATVGFYANSPTRPKGVKPISMFGGIGSGFVVSWSPETGHSLVVSAAHVCHDEETVDVTYEDKSEWEAPILGQKWKITNFKGEDFPARPVMIDKLSDVCFLDVTGWAGEVARLDPLPPPVGARLVTAGAPHGLYEQGLIPYQEGVFFGYKAVGEEAQIPGLIVMGTSIPVVQGMSGSAVYYRGKVVGFIDAVRTDFQHVSYLIQARDVIRNLPEAMKTWLTSLKNTSQSRR